MRVCVLMVKAPGAMLLLLMVLVECEGAGKECHQQVNAVLRAMNEQLDRQAEELRVTKEELEKKTLETLQAQARSPGYGLFCRSFAATQDHHIGPFDKDTTLVFKDHCLGGGDLPFVPIGPYDYRTGIFTSPSHGAYLFQYHVFGGGKHGIGAKLEVNGNHIVAAYNHKAPHDINTSQTVILELQKGDKVRLRLEKGWWIGAYTSHFTNFRGQYLFRLPLRPHTPDQVQTTQ
ncbi:uncharacterized protein LOC134441036 [Engraulis encrasicolus]|uniref:uncharacterized protein LOC134441036 n=1 Tax=Engraulis encrasicolus TaxID=184585 RepID=UPI002FD3BBAC